MMERDKAKIVFTDQPFNVPNAGNAGMGSFYRSQHEMICGYAAPGKPINNFGLGGKGRHRNNVWDYPGFSGFVRDRDEILALHPTVKPVAMVMDTIKDCSNRGCIVLDPLRAPAAPDRSRALGADR